MAQALSRRRGERGEELACRHCRKLGYAIADRNFHSRYGELDLVLRRGSTIRFVEVKLRSRIDFGTPGEFVVRRKQEKIRRCAQYWLLTHRLPLDSDLHFDVIAIHDSRSGVMLEYLPDAF